jgi:hypothetical protein
MRSRVPGFPVRQFLRPNALKFDSLSPRFGRKLPRPLLVA